MQRDFMQHFVYIYALFAHFGGCLGLIFIWAGFCAEKGAGFSTVCPRPCTPLSLTSFGSSPAGGAKRTCVELGELGGKEKP